MDDSRLKQIRQLVEPVLVERQMELVELTCAPQAGVLHLRLLVDRVGGVTIQQCAQANHLVEGALETQRIIEGSYTIEVSSPGLDRPLTTKRDFERAIGEELQLTLAFGEERFKELRGMLLAVQPDAIVVKTPAGNVTVAMTQIRSAKKALRW